MPDATARQIITRAFREAGVVGIGQDLEASMADEGLTALNGMVDSWTIDERYIFTALFQEFALTSGTQSYEIGATAAVPFNVARPARIWNANIIFSSDGTSRIPLEIIDDDQRMSIFDPDLTAGLPLVLHYRPTFPKGAIWLWPKPSSGYSLQLETWLSLTEFADLDASLVFPQGYYDALVYSMAERFCTPAYGRTIDPSITDLATKARMRIESLNLNPPPIMTCDPSAFGTGGRDNARGFTSAEWLKTGTRFYR